MVVLVAVGCFLFWHLVRSSKHPSNAVTRLSQIIHVSKFYNTHQTKKATVQ